MTQLQARKHTAVQYPLESYLREINETSLLKAEEEQELAYRVEAGDSEARDQMVRANLRLVVKIARGYAGKGLSLQDLIAEGNLGLLRAVEGFDPSMNIRFSTYASYWIKQSIKRAVINTGKTVRVPAYMFDLLVKWRRASNELQDKLGRAPTQEEVAQHLKLPKKKLAIIKKAIRVYSAGLQSDKCEAAWPLEELVMDSEHATPDHKLMKSDDLQQVLVLLDQMDAREAKVLRLRFGLDGEDPMTLKDIGARLGLTRERVRQIEREALSKMRERIEAE
jgi:RNA polymerase primary sigma factor